MNYWKIVRLNECKIIEIEWLNEWMIDWLSVNSLFLVTDGPAAGQTIPHVHVHILPRRNGGIRRPHVKYRNKQEMFNHGWASILFIVLPVVAIFFKWYNSLNIHWEDKNLATLYIFWYRTYRYMFKSPFLFWIKCWNVAMLFRPGDFPANDDIYRQGWSAPSWQ